jgi:RsiW-degrading membrane proteinase PrsW (M82 family)
MLGVGLALWLATAVVILFTGNTNLIPTLVLLGSFLVPVTFASWALERWRDADLTTELVVRAFFVGGVLGVLAASVLEAYLLHPSPWLFLGVGLIEEAVKLGALVLVTRGMPRRHARDGIILGAAVGFGFAAFETAGYAFNALLMTERGLSVGALVQTELLRSVLAPVGHGLWTAILGGLLFQGASRGHWLSGRLIFGYLGVSLLHALWDSSHELAVVITFVLTATSQQVQLLQLGYLPPATPGQVHLFTLLSLGFLAVVAVVGLLSLWAVWRSALRSDAALGYPRPSGRYE